jgi:hypothetical protein
LVVSFNRFQHDQQQPAFGSMSRRENRLINLAILIV